MRINNLMGGLVFTAFGVFALWLAVSIYQDEHTFEQSAVTATGRVTAEEPHNKSFRATVEFTSADGAKHTIQEKGSSNPPSYTVGQTVQVYYNPAEPEKGRIGGSVKVWLYILGGVALVFGGIGGWSLVSEVRRALSRNWLKVHGEIIQATITGVRKHARGSSNTIVTTNAWTLLAEAEIPGKGKFRFRTDDFTQDPQMYLPESNTLEVCINPHNPRVYWIDNGQLRIQQV